jgi:hypothetical protein
MTVTRSASGGLSTAEVERIRESLASGRRPKVMFTEAAGQIVGQTGQVVQLTDPQLSDEWLVVRFGHDELPFSPADLTMPPRNGTAKRTRPTPAPRPAEENPVPPTTTPDATRADKLATSGKPANVDKSAKADKSVKADKPAKTDKPAKPVRKTSRHRAPAGLTVTLEYTAGEWTVAAHQGSKVLAKPYLIKPGEALKMVAMLDVPGVHEAVEQLVATERAEAEQRAEQLRTQLAEVEAQLAELRDVG